MNGKYYGKREIRWQSREADRLEHIQRKDYKKCKEWEKKDEL